VADIWPELIFKSIYEWYLRSRSLNELVRTEGCRRYLCAAVACAARKPQGRAALIKQTQCTTQFCIQVGCPSPRRWSPRTIDRYYLGVQWTPNKSLRYLYLFGFLDSFLSDTSSFHNGFSWSSISSRWFHDKVDSSADFNAVPDSDASISTLRDGILRKNWDEYIC